jgi:hypothetical protein
MDGGNAKGLYETILALSPVTLVPKGIFVGNTPCTADYRCLGIAHIGHFDENQTSFICKLNEKLFGKML